MSSLNHDTSLILRAPSSQLAQAIVALQYGMLPQEWQKFGDIGREKSLRDMGYHLAYLSEAIAYSMPDLFIDYIAWVKVLFDGLNFSPDAVAKTLKATRSVVREQLNPEMAALVDEYIEAGLLCLDQDPKPAPIFVQDDLPLGGLARDYLAALLQGERQIASQLILDASARGVHVKDIYLHVFQRVQYEVGRLWQTHQISVAQEHFCTFVIQLNMSLLSPQIYIAERKHRRMVATCVGGDLHEIGMRMVTDFFEMEGWDTYYIGANTPTESIVKALAEQRADLLAISATLTVHISEVAELIRRVRASEQSKDVKILVGGYPFNVAETLWQSIGADGCGRDAQQALTVANALVDKQPVR